MKNIILILSLLLSINIFADYNFGVKVGVNYNNIVANSSIHGRGKNTEFQLNYSSGLFLIKTLSTYFYVSLEGLYNKKGFYIDEPETNILRNYTINYFEFPLILGFRYNNFYLYSGLYYAKYLDSKSTCNKDKSVCRTVDDVYDKELESSDTGIILGVGYKYKRFLFDLRYSKGIADINVAPKGSDDYTGIDNFYQFIFSVGFMFN